MENKFERIIFTLLRIFGVLSIIGAYLGNEGIFRKEGFLVLHHTTIIGNVFMISPIVIIEIIVTIIVYLVFIRLLAKHISITKKASN